MQRQNVALLLLLGILSSVSAWTSPLTRPTRLLMTSSSSSSSSRTARTTLYMSDQWEDEEEVEPTITTYDEATKEMGDAKAREELEKMGDDIVPGSETESQETIRDAIRSRTANLGMEESVVTKDFIAEAQVRAANERGSTRQGGLDLSKISTSTTASGSESSFDKLSINYEPEDDLTDEEMKEADPLGYESWLVQLQTEVGETTFPDPFSTFTRVVSLIIVALATGFIIVKTDSLVRELYMSKGFIPRPEDIANARAEGLNVAKELTKKAVDAAASKSGLNLPLP